MNTYLAQIVVAITAKLLAITAYTYSYYRGIFSYFLAKVSYLSIYRFFVILTGFLVFYGSYGVYSSSFDPDSNWVVVQLNQSGHPMKCFMVQERKLHHSPSGIYWNPSANSTISLSSPYRASKVDNGRWSDAFVLAGITENLCASLETSVADLSTPSLVVPKARDKLEALGQNNSDKIY